MTCEPTTKEVSSGSGTKPKVRGQLCGGDDAARTSAASEDVDVRHAIAEDGVRGAEAVARREARAEN